MQGVQITMAEDFDVSDRGSFYDKTGAIKDVIQNHLLQVLATVLAEPPDGTGLDSWRTSKSDLLGALRPLAPETTVKGQYQGYLDVAGVAPGSKTETYAAIRLAADSWRWADVPILIRAWQVPAADRDRGDDRLQAPAVRRLRAGRLRCAEHPALPGQPG